MGLALFSWVLMRQDGCMDKMNFKVEADKALFAFFSLGEVFLFFYFYLFIFLSRTSTLPRKYVPANGHYTVPPIGHTVEPSARSRSEVESLAELLNMM